MLVGRAAQLRTLLAAAEAVRSGRGRVAVVDGEAGIGKSRLVAALGETLQGDGFTVASASCQAAGAPPLWPWRQVLRPLGVALPGRVAQAGAAATGEQDQLARFVLFDALVQELRAVVERPLLLVLEDLHWADSTSLLLLDFLGAEVGSLPVMVVGTCRTGELDDADRLLRLHPDPVVSLAGLPPQDLAAVLEEMTGEALDADLTAAVHHRTGGNPFFAAEIVRLLRSEGRLGAAGLRHPAPAGALPATVRAALDRRLARLPAETGALLQAAAVLGAPFSPVLLSTVAEWSDGQVDSRLRPAADAGLLQRRPGGRWALVHDLVRDALILQIPAPQRRRLHERAAAALTTFGRDTAAIAHHLLEVAALGGERPAALAAAARAADEAMAEMAYEEATHLLTRALEVATPADGQDGARLRLLLSQGTAAAAAGDRVLARRAHLDAARLARRAGDPEALARAALGLSTGAGSFEVQLLDGEQIGLLEEALEALPAGDSLLRAALTARLSVALSFVAGLDRRRELAVHARDMAERLGDRATLAAALAAHCDVIAGPDGVAERLAASVEVVRLASAERDRAMELVGRRLRLVALAESGEWSAVDQEISRYAVAAQPLHQDGYLWCPSLWRGMRALMDGRMDDASGATAEVRRLAARSGSSNAALLADVQAWVWLMASDRPTAALDLMADVATRFGVDLEHPAWALCLARAGRVREARAVLDRHHRRGFDIPVDSEWLPAMTNAAEAAVLTGHRGAAAAARERLLPYAGLFSVEGIGAACWGSVDAHLGLLARFLGDADDATRWLRAADDLDGRAGRALAARTGAWSGALLEPDDRGPAGTVPTFRRTGEVWTLAFAGRVVQVRDLKGLHDLAILLGCPGRPVPVADLVGGGVDPGDAGEVADRAALDAYRRRVRDLEEDLAEAKDAGDLERTSRLRAEQQWLVDVLAAATGLGGRIRRSDAATERVRKAVTNRIRSAVERIEHVHPELGRHLRNSVRTGSECCYQPESRVRWRL